MTIINNEATVKTEDDHFQDCYEAVFAKTEMNETTMKFLREFWNLAYLQGETDGAEEQAERMLKMMRETIN